MAIGGNMETARVSGIHIGRIVTLTYVISAVCAGIAGILTASRLSSAQANAGTGWEMTIVSAVVIGGTSMSGGKGNMFGTALGAILMATIKNGLSLLNVNTFWHQVVIGLFILFAVALDGFAAKKAN